MSRTEHKTFPESILTIAINMTALRISDIGRADTLNDSDAPRLVPINGMSRSSEGGADCSHEEASVRTTRMYVAEESDSGIVPMNYSNKIEQSMAESEEGRPLIKENIHQSSTRPTQSGTRVLQGLADVRKASF
jgi:hypothetical protein